MPTTISTVVVPSVDELRSSSTLGVNVRTLSGVPGVGIATWIALGATLGLGALGASTAVASPGDLDPTFSDDGIVVTDIRAGQSDVVHDIAIQPDGRIVVAGYSDGENTSGDRSDDFALARYEPDGSLDPTFAGDGTVVSDFGASEDIFGIAIQSDGKIVAVGVRGPMYPSGQATFVIARYNANGSLDETFSDDGFRTLEFAEGRSRAFSAAVQPDGRIVVVGSVAVGSDFAIARFNSDGSLDSGFSSDGVQVTDINSLDVARDVVVQPDGKIVLLGDAGNHQSFAVARYLPDGSLDLTFGNGGTVRPENAATGTGVLARSVALQPDGKIVGAGDVSDPALPGEEFGIIRLLPDGSLDPTFGGDGGVATNLSPYDSGAWGVAIHPGGEIIAAGSVERGEIDADFGVVSYNPDGSPGSSFPPGGTRTTNLSDVTDEAHAVAIQADGKVIAAGHSYVSGVSRGSFALVRYEAAPPGFAGPETEITGGPAAGEAITNPARFSFVSASAGVAGFQCALDSTTYLACASPMFYDGLSDGAHRFSVRAVDERGSVDTTPASRAFIIESVAPFAIGPDIPALPVDVPREVAADTTPPTLSVNAARNQDAARGIALVVGCDESCEVVATGDVPRENGPPYELEPDHASLRNDGQAALHLEFRKRARRAIYRALSAGAKPRARIAVRATDSSGNDAIVRRSIRVTGGQTRGLR